MVLAGLLGVGMVVTVGDYWMWRREETALYGHGYEDGADPALALTTTFQDNLIRVRVKYPGEWKVKQAEIFAAVADRLEMGEVVTLDQVVEMGVRQEVANWGERLKLVVARVPAESSLIDIADAEVRALTAGGGKLSQERDYINTDGASLVVLTHKEEENGEEVTVQEVLGKKDEKLVVIEAKVKSAEWLKWKKTFDAIYRSVVII